MALKNTDKEAIRKSYYELIKNSLADEDIDYAIKGSTKTTVLNLPFVYNDEEGWLEISVAIKTGTKDEAYEGYTMRDEWSMYQKEKAEKAKKKAEATAKKKAKDEAQRKAKAESKARAEAKNTKEE